MRKAWYVVRLLVLVLADAVLVWLLVIPLGILLWPGLFVYGVVARRPLLWVSPLRSLGFVSEYELRALAGLFGLRGDLDERSTLETVDLSWIALACRMCMLG